MNIIVNQPDYVKILLEREEKLKELRATLRNRFGNQVFGEKSENSIENVEQNLEIDDDMYNGDTVELVSSAVRLSVTKILKIILVEYLTLNFYYFLTMDMCDELKRKIKYFLYINELSLNRTSYDAIKVNIRRIEKKLKEEVLHKSWEYCHYYRYLINRDMEELQIGLINDIEYEFALSFNKAIRVKGTMLNEFNKIVVDNEQLMNDNDEQKKKSDCCLCHLINDSCFYTITNHCICCKIFCPSLVYKDHEVHESDNCCGKLMIDGSFYNKTLKSFVGYFAAIFLIFVMYFYLRYQHYADALQGTSILAFFSIIFIFGLGFNAKVRAIVLLIFPILSTFQGRAILTYKALDICHNYLYPNFLTNVKNLEISYICTRGLLMDSISKFAEVSKFFWYIKKAVDSIRYFSESVRKAITALVRFLKIIMDIIKMVVKILKLVASICSDDFWNPMALCNDLVDEAVATCYRERWWICWPIRGGHAVCVLLSIASLACKGVRAIFGTLFTVFKDVSVALWDATLGRIFGSFADLFEFRFNATMVYDFKSEVDNSLMKFSVNVKNEINDRVDYFARIYDDINYVFPIALLYIFYSAWSYHRNYLKSNSFDNYIVSARFIEIDKIRQRNGKNTLLPLPRGMKYEFVELIDYKQTNAERTKTKWAIIFLIIGLLPIIYYVAIDSMMINVNQLVRKHLDFKVEVGSAASYGLSVTGNGFMANLYRFLFRKFESLAKSNITIDSNPCLPKISRYDLNAYKMLKVYVGLMFVCSIFQSYILRWRSVLIGSVYPIRDRERSIWLYNHILVFKTHAMFKLKTFFTVKTATMSRMNPLRYISQIYNFFINLISKVLYHVFNVLFVMSCYFIFCFYCCGICEKTNLAEFMYKNENRLFTFFTYIRSIVTATKYCMICGEPGDSDFKKCVNNLCKGYFCPSCFEEIGNSCPFCSLMMEYRNTGDDSFEVDSSDEDEDISFMNKNLNNNDNESENYEDEEEDLDYDYQEYKGENNGVSKKEQVIQNYGETPEEIKQRNALRKKLISEQIFPKIRENKEDPDKKIFFKISKRKTKRVISNILFNLYQVLDQNVEMFRLNSKRAHSAVLDVFLEDYNLYDGISEPVFKTIVENISMNEYFDIDELYKSSFYESLENYNINEDVPLFKKKND